MIKLFAKILLIISLSLSLSTFALSDDHKSSKEIISDLKSEIKELEAEPVKSKLLQRNTKYIELGSGKNVYLCGYCRKA